MNESPSPTTKPKGNTKKLLSVLLVIVIVGAAIWGVIWYGRNSAEAEAIAQLRALNKQAIEAGEPQPVVMQMDAGQNHVATIIIQGNLAETIPLLAKLHHVTEVYLAGTEFDDDDVAALQGLPKLNSLILSKTKITDAGVKQLPGSRLHQLHLAATPISAASVDQIGQMAGLEVLDLSHTPVHTNLSPLGNLEGLKWLLLNGCDLSQIDEASIEALVNLPNLGRLTVKDTSITSEVVERLKAAHPGLNVEAGGEPEVPAELTEQAS